MVKSQGRTGVNNVVKGEERAMIESFYVTFVERNGNSRVRSFRIDKFE